LENFDDAKNLRRAATGLDERPAWAAKGAAVEGTRAEQAQNIVDGTGIGRLKENN